MSEIYINYSNLEDSLEKSRKARNYFSDYASDIRSTVSASINKLPGNDSLGYTSTASNLALQKINDLNSKVDKFINFETKVTSILSAAKEKDNYVSTQIESISSMYIEKRNWFQNAGDWIYNTFCDLANKWDLVRDFTDAASWISTKIGNYYEIVVDWFKYGDGKYVANIVSAVVGTIVAIGGAVIAVCSIAAATPIAIAIGVVAAVAATVGAIITTINAYISVKQNSIALSKSGKPFDDSDGDPSAARYYGSQNKLSEFYNKNDMGSKADNEKFENLGEKVDAIKKVADITSFVCSIANLGMVRDYRIKNGSNVTGYSFTYDNIKKNILHSMGYDSKEVLDPDKAFFEFVDNIFENNIEKKFTVNWLSGSKKVPKEFIDFYKNVKIFDNIIDLNKNFITINDHFTYGNDNITWESTGEVVEAAVGVLENMDFYSPFGDYGVKTGKFFSNMVEVFIG